MKFVPIRRDANHLPIVNRLKELKYSVIDLAAVGHNVPDIVVADQHTTALIEIKTKTGSFYLGQLEFLAQWPGIAGFAETVNDCLNLMEDPEHYRLTWTQRTAILDVCSALRADEHRDQKQPRIAVRKFETLWAQAIKDVDEIPF